MKKILSLLLIVLLYSCTDGNFEIASFDFEDDVNVCGSYTLYKYGKQSEKEVLMLTLTEAEIKHSPDDVPLINISPSSKYTLTYRIFKTEADDGYFCATVPPVEPLVSKNYEGTGGKIEVVNRPVLDENGNETDVYSHVIILHDAVLESGDEILRFDQAYLYGEFETVEQ